MLHSLTDMNLMISHIKMYLSELIENEVNI